MDVGTILDISCWVFLSLFMLGLQRAFRKPPATDNPSHRREVDELAITVDEDEEEDETEE